MFARSFTRIARTAAPMRKMGGHAAPAHPQGGLEGKVRGMLPHDHQLSIAIIVFYATLITLVKVWPSKKKPAVAAAAASGASTGDIPSVDSAEFGDWISAPGNIEKLLQ